MRFKPFLICSSALTVATTLVFSGCEELGLIPYKEKQEQQTDGNEDDTLSEDDLEKILNRQRKMTEREKGMYDLPLEDEYDSRAILSEKDSLALAAFLSEQSESSKSSDSDNAFVNSVFSEYTIEQSSRTLDDWGAAHYGGFSCELYKTVKGGDRYLVVNMVPEGKFIDSGKAVLKVGQLNSGKKYIETTFQPGQKSVALYYKIDDGEAWTGIMTLFPLIIYDTPDASGNRYRMYANPIFVKSSGGLVISGWREVSSVGTVFGYFNDVAVCCNGEDNMDGNNDYQCVELCVRYLNDIHKISTHTTPLWGNAYAWPEYRSKEPEHYSVFDNDGNNQIREGDFIVWDTKNPGHIGVVVKVESDYISIAHQNGGNFTNYSQPIGTKLALDGKTVLDKSPDSGRNGKSPVFAEARTIPAFIRVISPYDDVDKKSDLPEPKPASVISVSSKNVDLGRMKVGMESATELEIINTGDAVLNLKAMVSSGVSASVPDNVLAPGAKTTLKVVALPEADGEFHGAVVVKSDAANEQYTKIDFTGTATTEPLPVIDISGLAFDLGTLRPGSQKDCEAIIYNTGEAPLTVRDLTFYQNDDFFLKEDIVPFVLQPGQGRAIGICYKAVSEGTFTGKLIVKSDAVNKNDPRTGKFWTIELKAKVQAPSAESCCVASVNYDGKLYSIWQEVDKDGTPHINADRTGYYPTVYTLTIADEDMVLQDVCYIGGVTNYFCGGPAMAVDTKTGGVYVYTMSKNDNGYYKMQGNIYKIEGMEVISRQTIFNDCNYGWYPYFTCPSGQLVLNGFSYAGYFEQKWTLSDNDSWTYNKGSYISPNNFENRKDGYDIIFFY